MKHGTYYGYTTGCRCEPCVDAVRVYWRERSRRVRGTVIDREAFTELLHELCPDGLTTPEERAMHESLAA